MRALEERFEIEFDRSAPMIRTSLLGAEQAIRDWIASWPSQGAIPPTE